MIQFTTSIPLLGTITYTPPEDVQEFLSGAGPSVVKAMEKYFNGPLASTAFYLMTAFSLTVMDKGDGETFINLCADFKKSIEEETKKLGNI